LLSRFAGKRGVAVALKHSTDVSVKAAIAAANESEKRREISDKVQSGPVLRVTPNGASTFAFAYRLKGQSATQRIGPELNLLEKLIDAR